MNCAYAVWCTGYPSSALHRSSTLSSSTIRSKTFSCFSFTCTQHAVRRRDAQPGSRIGGKI
eukprot:2294208-Amphidinium_carterae.1